MVCTRIIHVHVILYLYIFLWPDFIDEGTAGLNICVHFALSIDEVNVLSQKISKKIEKLKCIYTLVQLFCSNSF